VDEADPTFIHTYFLNPTLGSAGLIENDSDTAIRVSGGGQRGNLTNSFDVPLASEISIEFWATASHAGNEDSAGFILGTLVGNDICWCTLPWGDEILYFDFGDFTGPGRITTDYTSYIATKTHVVLYSGGTSGDHKAIWLNATLVNCIGSSDGPGATLTGGEVCDRSQGIGVDAYKGIMDEFAVYLKELNSATIYEHFLCGVGSVCGTPFQGERWDNFDSFVLAPTTSEILVQHVPAGWSGRILSPNSTVLESAVASNAAVIFDWESQDSPSSGFLLLFTDGNSFTSIAKGGRFPSSGTADFVSGDVYDYARGLQEITATQTFIPICDPKGGFANVGSGRLRNEMMGYATFTDSQLEGVTRGAGDTTATSHSNLVSLQATVLLSGGGLIDFSAPFTDVDSNVNFFTEQSQYLYLGTDSRFAVVAVTLAINADTPLALGYEYSTADGVWANLQASGFIPVFDATSGFTQTGRMSFEPPGNWETTRGTLPGSNDLTDGNSRFYLRVINTTTAATPPQEMDFFLDGEVIFAVRKASAFLYTPTLVDSGQALTFKAISVGGRGPQVQDGILSPVFTIQESSS